MPRHNYTLENYHMTASYSKLASAAGVDLSAGPTVPGRRSPGATDPLRAVQLCTEMGRALHRYGTSAPRLEQRLRRMSEAVGVPAELFVTPTAVLASYRIPGKVRAHTQLLRLEPGTVNLGRLAAVETLLEQVCAGTLRVPDASLALAEIVARPAPESALCRALGAAAVSAAAARFFGGGWPEVLVAAFLGVLIGVIETVAAPHRSARWLVPPAVAALVTIATIAAARALPGLSVPTAQLAGLIVLVPGLDFTLAIKEIASAHLVSGAARLVAAIGEFLALGFGVALGSRVGVDLLGESPAVQPGGLPGWTLAAAFAVAALGFGERFRAHRRDLPWVWIACAVGYGGAALGVGLLGPALGAFVGAVLVGVASNAYARWSARSPLVMMVPGIILLVPGSVGFRSFAMLLRHDVVPAVETAFTMALTATAISTGLLLANVLLPSERREKEQR